MDNFTYYQLICDRFPLGVFATATYQLATDLHSEAFKVIGAFQAVQVTVYWLYVFLTTVFKVANRTIFVAPELEGWEKSSRWSRKVLSSAVHQSEA